MRLLLCAVVACGTGCSTLTTLTSSEDHPWLYSGTRWNLDSFSREVRGNPYGGIRECFSIFDFPWSLVLDTVVLPFTLPLQLVAGDQVRGPIPPAP